MAKNPRLIDMGGQRYGAWTILDQAGNTPGGGALWSARCDCGTRRVVLGADVRKGKSTNCGCKNVNRLGDLARTHGEGKSRIYTCWQNMRRRCGNPNNVQYPDYGGRGISICPEWDDFAVFKSWAVASGYRDDLTIERIDVNGNYEPSNCTWADAEVQSNNRRFVRKMADGRPAPLVAKENGIPARVFNWRTQNGWSIEEAATHPLRAPRVARPRNDKGQFA